MNSTTKLHENPFKNFPTERIAELYDFINETAKSFTCAMGDIDEPVTFSAMKAERFVALVMLKLYVMLGMITSEDAEHMPLADFSSYSAYGDADAMLYVMDTQDELWESILNGELGNYDVKKFLPDPEDTGIYIYDDDCGTDGNWGVDPDDYMSDVADYFTKAKITVSSTIDHEVRDMFETFKDSEGEIGYYRLMIIASQKLGKAINRSVFKPSPEGDLLKKVLTSHLFMVNYFVGWWVYDGLDNDTYWGMYPCVYDWNAGSGNENTDQYENPAFPILIWMASELADRILQ